MQGCINLINNTVETVMKMLLEFKITLFLYILKCSLFPKLNFQYTLLPSS